MPALDGIDLRIAAGERLALVGPSGAGKTSLFQLLLRFYEAGEGHIRIDGHDIRALPLRSLRARIAIPVGAFADPGFPPPVFSVYEARKHAWVQLPEHIEHMD